jgi:hypothetical protein
MRPVARDMSERFAATWDHVEQVLRHEHLRAGEGAHLIRLIADMRAAGFDRKLRARRTLRAPLVLARSASRALRSTDPVIVFVCQDDRIVSLVGTIETFQRRAVAAGTLTPHLARDLTRLATSPTTS